MVKKIYFTLLFILLVFSSNTIFSQQEDYINGILLDAKLNEPIAFATIRIKGRALGVVSNFDGGFRIPLKFKEYGDILEISSMGYQSKEILINDLSIYLTNNIRILPAVLELEEVVVSAEGKRRKRLSARRIVRKAIEAIPVNYPETSFSTVGYYRDYQLQDGKYLNLNEALLEVFDPGFDEIDSTATKTRLYEYLKNKNFPRDTLAENPYNYKDYLKTIDNAYLDAYGGNEFAILRIHDAIRNYQINSYDFVNNIKEGDILKNHSFKRLSYTYLEDETLYTIELKKEHPNYTVSGSFYISQSDFAIHKIEYAVYDKKKPNTDDKLGELDIKSNLIFAVTTEYKRQADYKMYLNYISLHNTFQLTIAPKFIMKELLISQVNDTFTLSFNNRLADEPDAEKSDWYDFKYRDEKVKFKWIKTVDDTLVSLRPSKGNKSINNMMDNLVAMAQKGRSTKEVLKFKVTGLVDVDGNLLNQPTYKNYDQFREFFAQEIKTIASPPDDNLFMNKNRPIFKNQPVARPDNFSDYWMNTPLQKNEK